MEAVGAGAGTGGWEKSLTKNVFPAPLHNAWTQGAAAWTAMSSHPRDGYTLRISLAITMR